MSSMYSSEYSSEFSAPPQPEPQPDLLSHLYREIGIMAVAAALDAIQKPGDTSTESHDDHPLPAILRMDDLAA